MILAQTATPVDLSYGWLFAKTIGAMIVIIALAFVSIRYVLPLFMKLRRKSDSQIQVLDMQLIEPHKSVYLLKVRNKTVALATSEHAVAKLAEWEGDERTNS